MSVAPSPVHVLDARPVRVGEHRGTRYRLHRAHPYTGDDALDDALSTFGAVVVPPVGDRSDAPAVSFLNGIAQPMARSTPAARALVSAGVGVVLMDTPFAGGRRPGDGPAAQDLIALGQSGAVLDRPFVRAVFDGVAGDLTAVLAFAEAEHGVGRGQRALLGVSFGCLLSSLAFARDGVGDRLLGAIGHPGLPGMARGLVETFAAFSGLPAPVVAAGLRLGAVADVAARKVGGEAAVGALRFARLLDRLGRGGDAVEGVDPLAFAGGVGPERAAHFLAGERDPVAPVAVVRAAAAAFATSSVEVVSGLGHGWYAGGRPAGAPSFEAALGAWAVRHLADWG